MEKKWTKFRHKITFYFFKPIFSLVFSIKYHYRYEKVKLEKKKAYLILCNHQTGNDQFLLNVAFNRPMYIVANSNIFSLRIVSRIIKFLTAPISKDKKTKDITTIRNCVNVAKEGGNIAIFPEGNTTFSGCTENIDIAIAKLAKLLNIPIVLYNISGGYKYHPRWANNVRKSFVTGSLREIIPQEEVKSLSIEELHARIKNGLFVDDTKCIAKGVSKKRQDDAEGMESLIYVCPKCGISHFKTEGDTITCSKCGYTQTYTPSLTFSDTEGFKTVKEWYDYQNKFTANYPIEGSKLISEDKHVKLKEIFEHKKKMFDEGVSKLYTDKLIINGIEFMFENISGMSIFRHNRLDFDSNDRSYQIKAKRDFNAVKYLHFYTHYKNMLKGEINDEFLGL